MSPSRWIALALALSSPLAQAQQQPASGSGGMYYYYDESGALHVTDQLQDVPEAARKDALDRSRAGQVAPDSRYSVTEAGQPAPISEPVPQLGQAPAPPAEGEGGADDIRTRAYWQEQLAAQRTRRAEAEARIKEIEQELIRVKSTRPNGFHEALFKLDGELAEQKAIVADAQQQIDKDIPARAKKLGIPPGWLR